MSYADVYDTLQGGNAFSNPLPDFAATPLQYATAGTNSVTSLLSVSDVQVTNALAAGGLTPTALNTAKTMYAGAATGIGTLTSYGAQSVNEAYDRISASTSYKSGLKSIGREPNNCDLINRAFGILQREGQLWLERYNTVLSAVNAKMDQLMVLVNQGIAAGAAKIQAAAAAVLTAVNEANAKINALIAEVEAGIAAELAHIQSMIKSCFNFGFANILQDWLGDGCAAATIKSIGSDQLNKAISS